jgi:Flp pilus assembly pilin Flp
MNLARKLAQLRPRDEAGQDAAEYALLMAIVVFFLLLGMAALGDALADVWMALAAAFS